MLARPHLLFLLVWSGCSDSPVTGPIPATPADHMAVVAGRVTDTNGNRVPGASVSIWATCFLEPFQGCPSEGTSITTDAQGEFLRRFEFVLPNERRVGIDLAVRPPLGMGYVLGKSTVEGVSAVYQRPPVRDTTRVQILLPPNHVESRRPIRVEPGYHLSDLYGDARRFYVSSAGVVAAIDPATGECLWEIAAGGLRVGPRIALLGDQIVVAGFGRLAAYGAVDGAPRWTRDVSTDRALTTSGTDGLYMASDRSVTAFDATNGATRWTRELIGSGTVVLAASAELVCAEILAFVECWEPTTGEQVWTRPTPDFGFWLAFAAEVVLMGSRSGWTAMDIGTGEIVWEIPLAQGPPPVFSTDRELAFACSGQACFAIRTADGALASRTPFDRYVGAPVFADGLLYVTVGQEYGATSLYVLDAQSGAIRERILPDPFDYGFCDDPVLTSGHLAIRGCGSLYTFERP